MVDPEGPAQWTLVYRSKLWIHPYLHPLLLFISISLDTLTFYLFILTQNLPLTPLLVRHISLPHPEPLIFQLARRMEKVRRTRHAGNFHARVLIVNRID